METVDTVDTMNNVITQVVEGSHLAEKAGEQMRHTQNSTKDLVASVKQIASSSSEQVVITKNLQDNANNILDSNKKTSEQLQKQTIQTKRLVDYANGLLKAVKVFKLTDKVESKDKKQRVLPEKSIENKSNLIPEIVISTAQKIAS